ncbi:MAG TPA: long-chain fatty acid--CoA ligase [Candidatus Polarisedimenticolaceae bacterium]|nr:long-chain fatty acid--CoA ligase [Candidatus Polarisedimenticolaceae bacterium]
MEYRSLYELFQGVSTTNSDRPAYRHKPRGSWVELTWADARALVNRVSKALMALDVGQGQRVAILSRTRLEWSICDFGIVGCGGVTVGIYPSNLAEDCAYILEHCDAEVIFVENGEQLEKIFDVRARLPRLRRIVVFDGAGDASRNVVGWDEFLAIGDAVEDGALERRGRGLEPTDLASLVYTSGTTGVPKGAMITHENLIFTSWSAGQCLYLEPDFCTLMFLPLAHIFARLISYCCMRNGNLVAFAEDITTVAADLKEIRPHFIASVPRIYEKVYDKVISGAERAGGVKLKLFNFAIDAGTEASRLRQAKKPIPAGLKLRHAIADRLVLHKIRDAFGGRLVWAVSGAAPLNPMIAEFFDACGVTILEGIGMTENTSFTNVNRLDNNKFGTVGQVGPGIEQRIAEDGEVLYRGANLMKGYFKDEASTAETIDEQGWLKTGDIGELDDEGFLRITDRKKDLIVTAGGKNVAPQRIERIMRTSRYIAQVVAHGDKRRYITALVTLDPENMSQWAAEHGRSGAPIAELAQDAEVVALIEHEIAERNKQLASFESVKKFHILPRDFSIEEGELTPTLKIKRKVVFERYRGELDALY